jgi:hypothetical protein
VCPLHLVGNGERGRRITRLPLSQGRVAALTVPAYGCAPRAYQAQRVFAVVTIGINPRRLPSFRVAERRSRQPQNSFASFQKRRSTEAQMIEALNVAASAITLVGAAYSLVGLLRRVRITMLPRKRR